MSQSADAAGHLLHDRAHRLHVNARRREQGFQNALATQVLASLAQLLLGTALDTHLAGQRVAVGMQAGRGEADEHVAFAHAFGIEHARAIDQAHAETGQIVVVRVHHAGMLGHLAADERAAGLAAALADAADDLGHGLGIQLAHGHVVEEEQRLRAGGKNVVHAHGHQIDAHRIVHAKTLSDLELRAHAIGARHQKRIDHVLGHRDGEQAAEAADVAHHFGAIGGMHRVLDGVHGTGALHDIDAGLGIGHAVLVFHGVPFSVYETSPAYTASKSLRVRKLFFATSSGMGTG